MSFISNEILFTTCHMNLNYQGNATGFFYKVDLPNNQALPCIVTNKHVIEGIDTLFLKFFVRNMVTLEIEPEFAYPQIDLKHSVIFEHPSQDLCAIPFSEQDLEYRQEHEGYQLFYTPLCSEHIVTPEIENELLPIEDITMIGYPEDVWDELNNMPIVRRGITATNPCIDFNRDPFFLTDLACFPGSSGSPVFLFNQGVYATRHGLESGQRVYLLGIHTAGEYIHEAISGPKKDGEIVETNLYSCTHLNLGYALKSRVLGELDSQIKATYNYASKHRKRM